MGTSSFPKGHLGLEPSWKLGGSFQRGHRWRRFILRAQNQLQSTSVEPLALMTVPLADNCAQRLINFSVVSRAALRWKTDLWSVPCNSVKLGRNGISCIRGSDLTYHPEPVAFGWCWMFPVRFFSFCCSFLSHCQKPLVSICSSTLWKSINTTVKVKSALWLVVNVARTLKNTPLQSFLCCL